MSFGSILRGIVEQCGDALGAALMGNDGIAIDEFATEPRGDEPAFDIATAGVEFGRILDDVRKASDALGGGDVEETIVRTARFLLVFRIVDDEYFVVVAIRPDGNLGKARYLIRRSLLAIREEL